MERTWRWFGRADIVELVRIFEKQNPDLPMRVVHGMYNSFSLVIFLSQSTKSDLQVECVVQSTLFCVNKTVTL